MTDILPDFRNIWEVVVPLTHPCKVTVSEETAQTEEEAVELSLVRVRHREGFVLDTSLKPSAKHVRVEKLFLCDGRFVWKEASK